MSREKELAYRYDLFISPDWGDRFDAMVDEHIQFPKEGRILDVNCGTGGHTASIAATLDEKGEVIGVDPSEERLELARAKAQALKLTRLTFQQSLPWDLPFSSHEFDAVSGDVSLLHAGQVEEVLDELIRVAQPGASVVLRMTTHGSFDELFSLYWEALLATGLVDEVWSSLEAMINERLTVSDAERMAERAGLSQVKSFTQKEEFSYANAAEFLESPVIADYFLADWLEIVPEGRRDEVLRELSAIIDGERYDGAFEVSIKATLIAGVK
jgi:ubiquinone/menaquinone biosynthesis C-methylase UbiE